MSERDASLHVPRAATVPRRGSLRRWLARLGFATAAIGLAIVAWALTVWLWQDPFTALYTRYEQHELARQYDHRSAGFRLPVNGSTDLARLAAVAAAAGRYRLASHSGEAMGTIDVPRLGLHHMVLVDGTDESSLEKGPGIYRGDYLPGEHELVYIAGHRTTFLAPFAEINELRKGDPITIHLPYGTFLYRVTGYRIVVATDLSVLQTHQHEELVLQACHPRFFATHRYLAYARLVEVIPTGQRAITGPVLTNA